MSERRFTTPGPRHRSWAECYAVSRRESWSSSDWDLSGRNSPDQSNVIDLDPPNSSSSSSSHSSSSSSSSPESVFSNERRVLYITPAPSTPRNSTSRPATPPTSTRRLAPSPEYSQGRCCSASQSRSCQRRRSCSRARGRFTTRIYFSRHYRAHRHWGHLPVAIPPDRWYVGVGSLVCAQCRLQGAYHRTSWMCLQCEVPLCLLTWRNCYSQWHSE